MKTKSIIKRVIKSISFSALLLSFTIALNGAPLSSKFFMDVDQFLNIHVKGNGVDYASAKSNPNLSKLISAIAETDLANASSIEKKAFYINAYNLLVINAVASAYPTNSVNEISGFFDSKKYLVAGEKLTLNKLEKDKLIKTTGDARLHFVLVCGAVDCPPIVGFAYTPEKLEQQLETQTKKALNNAAFIKPTSNGIELSQIFKWYVNDFGGNQKSVVEFINNYRTTPIKSSDKISYYNYDWNLNNAISNKTGSINTTNTAANASRYVVSAAIPKGTIELKLFNNLYSQKTGSNGELNDQTTFFTSTVSALYGLSNRFNAGFEFRYRRVNFGPIENGPFAVFNGSSKGQNRQGITGFGPKVRIAPFKSLENFSIQSTLTFATRNDLASTESQPYIDWNGPTWWTQFFNDFSLGNNFSLFTEIDVLIEDIGSSANQHTNRVSTPATIIFSYFPNTKTTLYTLGGFSPFYQETFDYFYQFGVGAKYQINPNFELELLYTDFSNKFLDETGGRAETFNFGIRYNL